MKIKCVIFDLDGTLADTIEDIALFMNKALELHGFPPLASGEYVKKVGWGIKKLAFLSLPQEFRDEGLAEKVAADAARFYEETPLVRSKLYPGIRETVAELRRKKIKTAVLTNKPDPAARLVTEGLFPPFSFDIIRGDRPGFPRKPDPASTWEILMDLDISPRETVFMGDSEIDIETAHASGCHALAVSWGFRPPDLLKETGLVRIINSPGELLDFIKETRI
jgi:phosphoglycolate phosphatase